MVCRRQGRISWQHKTKSLRKAPKACELGKDLKACLVQAPVDSWDSVCSIAQVVLQVTLEHLLRGNVWVSDFLTLTELWLFYTHFFLVLVFGNKWNSPVYMKTLSVLEEQMVFFVLFGSFVSSNHNIETMLATKMNTI